MKWSTLGLCLVAFVGMLAVPARASAADSIDWDTRSPASGSGWIAAAGIYATDPNHNISRVVLEVWPTANPGMKTSVVADYAGGVWGKKNACGGFDRIKITGLAAGQYTCRPWMRVTIAGCCPAIATIYGNTGIVTVRP